MTRYVIIDIIENGIKSTYNNYNGFAGTTGKIDYDHDIFIFDKKLKYYDYLSERETYIASLDRSLANSLFTLKEIQ